MKTLLVAVMLVAAWVMMPQLARAQASNSNESIAEYDVSKETRSQGVIAEVKDRICPISRGVGSHFTVKIDENVYEVHVAPVKFVKMYGAAFQSGETVEIVGVMTKFQGVDAILPREIRRGNQGLVFRDEKGRPMW
jgi:DNA/RNA endonuclease YhcR with UshA esterase domain